MIKAQIVGGHDFNLESTLIDNAVAPRAGMYCPLFRKLTFLRRFAE
jgi:hypothetical protein